LSRFRLLIVLAASLTAALAIAACGGDDGSSDEDPQEVLQATFAGDQALDSGVLDLDVEIKSEGGELAGNFEAGLGGPFQSEDGAFPTFDLEAEASQDVEDESLDFSGNASLTSTGDAAFVGLQDNEYQVPQQAFEQFATTFTRLQTQSQEQGAQEAGGVLSAIGVHPTEWLTELENEGEEDVEGTETVHISGQADVESLVGDLRTIAEKAPQAAGQKVTPQQLAQLDALTGVIESADFDIYSGKDDDQLRKLEGSLALNPPDGEGAPETVTISFTLTLSEVNEPQEIEAPADAQPFDELLAQVASDPSALGGLGSALGQGAGGATPPEAGGSPDPTSDSDAAAYLECIGSAEGQEALDACEHLMP
jgi:hypothetical protein